jgi:hypothetical protein
MCTGCYVSASFSEVTGGIPVPESPSLLLA